MTDFNLAITGIGSLPHTDSSEACRLVLENFSELPFWPQLPRRTLRENMYAQFAEGLPGFTIDEGKKKVYVDTDKDLSGQVEKSFQRYLDGDVDFFAITKERAEGFYKFLELKDEFLRNKNLKFLKAQITGPVSFGLSITDKTGKAMLYYKEFEELIPKLLTMKANFQIKTLKKYFDNIILFIDEPYLTSIGSSYVNIDMAKSAACIDELASAIKEKDVLTGLHCCGNTDWSFILKRNIDILSFDAYNFMREFLLYPEDIKKFLDDGRTVAWGIVPTSEEALRKENEGSLIREFEKKLKSTGLDMDKLFKQSILTPSCGCGTLTVEETKKAFNLLKGVSERLKH